MLMCVACPVQGHSDTGNLLKEGGSAFNKERTTQEEEDKGATRLSDKMEISDLEFSHSKECSNRSRALGD